MFEPVNHAASTQQSYWLRLFALVDERELPESLRLEFTRSLGPAFVPFLFGGSVAASLAIAISVYAENSLALFFACLALIGFGLVVSACHAASQPADDDMLRRIEMRYSLGAVMASMALGGIVLAIILAGTAFIVQTLLVMVGLAVLGVGAGSGPGRPRVAMGQALGLGVPIAIATLIAWPEPWNFLSFLGVLAYTLASLLMSNRSYATQSTMLRAREQQRAERLRINTALRHLSQPIVMLDQDLNIMLVNPSALRILGLPEQADQPLPRFPVLLAQAPNLARANGNQDEFMGHAAMLMAARQPFNGALRLNDDRVVDLECIPVPDVGWVTILRDTTGEYNAIAELNRELRRCPLTGLPNRRAFMEELERRLGNDEPVCLLAIDLESFKQVNERHGRAVGDRILTRVGFRLRTAEPSLFVARISGDEFAVLLADNDPAQAMQLARSLLASIDIPARFGDAEVNLSAAIGIALAPRDGMLAETLLDAADLALLAAKAEPSQPIQLHSPMLAERSAQDAAIEAQVRSAIRRREVLVVYQPMLDLRTGKVIAIEALARMPAATANEIGTAEMVAIAEARGLTGLLRQQVLQQAARVAFEYSADISLWVNASVIDLRNPLMVDEMLADLDAVGLSPTRCAVEVTETALIRDEAICLANLQRLIDLGAGVAMDDFGAGFSSLHRLGRLPINALKISGTLLTGMEASPVVSGIFRTAVNLGRSMGLVVVAEGVETPAELALAHSAGADRIQGYLLSRPVEAERLAETIRDVERKAAFMAAA